MIITPQFVYIHMPKTSRTFICSVLDHLHNHDTTVTTKLNWFYVFLNFLKIKKLKSKMGYGPISNLSPKHGTCHDIPSQYKDKLILSTVRNPYDWYVSQYEFSWWKRTFMYDAGSAESKPTPAGFAIECALPDFQKRFPHFPDISFDEFIQLCNEASDIYNQKYGSDFGLYTHSFIHFFYQNAKNILSCTPADKSYIHSDQHKLDMFNVNFLKTHSVNQDLYNFLLSIGYQYEDLQFVLKLKKIFPEVQGKEMGRSEEQVWQKYYHPGLKKTIRDRDWILYEMFPDFDL